MLGDIALVLAASEYITLGQIFSDFFDGLLPVGAIFRLGSRTTSVTPALRSGQWDGLQPIGM